MAKKIVVIDDEPSVRDAFELALDDLEYEVFTACDGIEGVEIVNKYNPDLVFLDLKMPKMNGVEALKEIKKLSPSVPVYIISAFQKEFFSELQEVVEEGYQFNLAQKPLSGIQIREIVSSIL
jgi:DNA-binding NtrC family response regulator